MNDDLITEYVELCEQIAATELLDGLTSEAPLYERLDQIWCEELTDEERRETEERLVAKARQWHDARRAEDS